MSELSAAELRELLKPWARKLLGEVTGAALDAAGKAHPLMRSLASEIMGLVITEQTLSTMLDVLEHLLTELLGDDYPLVVDAQKAVIVDKRTGDPQ